MAQSSIPTPKEISWSLVWSIFHTIHSKDSVVLNCSGLTLYYLAGNLTVCELENGPVEI